MRQQLVRIAGWSEDMEVVSFAAPWHELLNPAAADRLGDVQVAFRIRRDGMQKCELSRIVTGTPEAGEDSLTGRRSESGACQSSQAVEGPHDLVAAIGVKHQLLPSVGRKFDIPRRAGCSYTRGAGSRDHGNDLYQVT